jgi:recombination protein RecT
MTTEMQVQARTPVEAVCNTIKNPKFREQLASALPPGVDVDRFQRVVLTAIQQNPKIAEVQDRNSLYNACVRAAVDGLLPDNREGALVEFRKKDNGNWISAVQWMPMIAGIIKRLATAGITIDAQVVYENDTFEQEFGDDAKIIHKAPRLGQKRGNPIGAYAIARLPNGMVMREVMDYEQIEQVRAASRSKDGGPWSTWWTEMARKTVTRRLAKRLPILDQRVAETIAADDDLYDFATANAAPTDSLPAPEPAPTTPTGQRRPRGLQSVAAAGTVVVDTESGEILSSNGPADDDPSPAPAGDPSGDGDF